MAPKSFQRFGKTAKYENLQRADFPCSQQGGMELIPKKKFDDTKQDYFNSRKANVKFDGAVSLREFEVSVN